MYLIDEIITYFFTNFISNFHIIIITVITIFRSAFDNYMSKH